MKYPVTFLGWDLKKIKKNKTHALSIDCEYFPALKYCYYINLLCHDGALKSNSFYRKKTF